MLKALTFLGIGPPDGYQSTTYIKHDETESCETHIFPEAVAKLYNPEQITVFATPIVQKDEKGYLRYLQARLDSELHIENIPNGNSESELWEIFQICTDAVDEGDEVILDITHAFRSLPLLIFIVAAYLRQVKSVVLKHIIYGAFEARNPDTNHTPIFDLTPFVELLDWINAFAIFRSSGDAREIAKLNVPNNIERALTNVSAALLTNRTLEAQEAVSGLLRLDMNHPQNLLRQPAPFQMLTETLKENYQNIGVYQPRSNPKQSLEAQYKQIKWYIENQHYLQAITLMREWLVSWECLQLHQEKWLNHDNRNAAEDVLNERVKHQDSQFAKELVPLISHRISTNLWRQCRDLRNDFAHCGMREDPIRSHKAIEATKSLFSEFEGFVQLNLKNFS